MADILSQPSGGRKNRFSKANEPRIKSVLKGTDFSPCVKPSKISGFSPGGKAERYWISSSLNEDFLRVREESYV
jgi:hypothetical protein